MYITPETMVEYEQSMYTLFEEKGHLEVCLVVTRNGSQTPFVINITTTNGTAGKCSVCNMWFMMKLTVTKLHPYRPNKFSTKC